METFIVYAIIFVFIAIGLCAGWFSNQAYSNKYAQKKATEIKNILEHINKAESFSDIKNIIGYYSVLLHDYNELNNFKNQNHVAYEQTTSIASNRYQTIHKKSLSILQRRLLNLNISFMELYSDLIVDITSKHINILKNQISILKTNDAKEKRIRLINDIICLAKQELQEKGISTYIQKIDSLSNISSYDYTEENSNSVNLNLDIQEMCVNVLVERFNYEKESAKNLVYNSFGNKKEHTPTTLIKTQAICSLLQQAETIGKKNNPLLRKEYETPMPSKDNTIFLKERLKEKDYESIYQYFCLLHGWKYDAERYSISNYAQDLFIERLKKYYRGKRSNEIYDIIESPHSISQYKEFLSYVDKEFKCIGSDFVLLNLKQEYMKDQERIQRIISIDFSKFLQITDDCRDEILITFIDLLPYFNLSRGRFNAFGDDSLANRITYSLSIYDFNVINISPLVQRANLVIEEERSISDYYEDIPLFDNIPNQVFKSPVSENLKSKLILYGTAERYFLLHDCIECNLLSPSPYYKTKEMGIDENDTWDRFIKDELIIKNMDNQCLLSLTKNDLIELANKLDILVRKSWNKDKIYATILEDKNKENELKQFIYDLDFYKINPIYENELIQLIDYKKRIAQLIQLLFFI